MDNGAIRAIMAGTVAYDTFNGHAAWPEIPPRRNSGKIGVLIIGLSRQGGQGEFLNIKETEALVDGLERYIKGVRLLNTLCTAAALFPPLEALSELLNWVRTVDNLSGSKTAKSVIPSSPFIQTKSDMLSIEQVISMFKSRCKRALDPNNEVHQIQSPLYVTCSAQLDDSSYPVRASRGQFLEHKPLGLIINVLEALNIPVELSIQIALFPILSGVRLQIKGHELEQLFPAEQLISALAYSLVDQSGLNTFKIESPVSSPVPTDLEALEHTPATHETALKHTIALIREHCGTMVLKYAQVMSDLDYRLNKTLSVDSEAVGVAAQTAKDLYVYLSDDGPREEVRQRLARDEEELQLYQQLLQGAGGDKELLLEMLAISSEVVSIVVRELTEEEDRA